MAINYADGNLFYKDSSNQIKLIASNQTLSAVGNITGGNLLTGGLISATGNITGNYILGNGAYLTGVITSVANINNGTSNVSIDSSGGNVTVGVGGTGNVAVFATTGEYITGVLSEHQGGAFLDMKPAGIRVRGRRSTPGRYFQVAEPGLGWGGTNISDPLEIIEKIDPKVAWPGLKLLMVSTTGEHSGWFVLDNDLKPRPTDMPVPVRAVVERIAENCEPAL